MDTPAPGRGPLAGFRVLSLEHYLAGNHGTWLMSMFGAEIIKIERPTAGDTLRGVGPFLGEPGDQRSGGELRVMGNKRSVALDLASRPGREVFFRLAEQSDVVWSNQKPSSTEKLGITFDALVARNPRIVYATLSGFGHGDLVDPGPLADTPAFDIIAQGVAGLQFRAAGEDGTPGYNGLALGDEFTSTLTVLGVFAALLRRERCGGAQRVDVAMHDSMVFLNELAVGMLSLFGRVPPRGRSGTSAPYGAFRSRDGWVNIAVGGDPVWRRFCAAIDRDDLSTDPRSTSSFDRVSNATWIEDLATSWTSVRDTEDILATLGRFGVPCAAVLDVADVLVSEQVRARRMLVSIDDPAAGPVRVVGNPVKMNDLPDGAVTPPARLGEDTADVLTTIGGYSAGEVEELAADGTVALGTASGRGAS